MGEIIKALSDNRVSEALKDLGIPVTNSNGVYRPLIDIINELSERWENLTERQKNYICDIAKENIDYEE